MSHKLELPGSFQIYHDQEFIFHQSSEFFLFAGLMFIDMLLFMYLAYRYKSVESVPEEEHQLMEGSSADESFPQKNDKALTGLDNVAFTKDTKADNN